MIALVVTQPFADFVKGDRITDQAKIEQILADHHHRVIRVSLPDDAASQGVDKSAPRENPDVVAMANPGMSKAQ